MERRGDRPADDEIVRPGADRRRRRRGPLLVVRLGPGRPDAGRDDGHVGTDDPADGGGLGRRGDDPVHAGGARVAPRGARPARASVPA